jgi:hypothetical protein
MTEKEKDLFVTISIQEYVLAKKVIYDIERGNAKQATVALFMAGGRSYWDGCIMLFEQAAIDLNVIPEDIDSIRVFTDGTGSARVNSEAVNINGEVH